MPYSSSRTKERFDFNALTTAGMAGIAFDSIVQHLAHDPDFLKLSEATHAYKAPQVAAHPQIIQVIESVASDIDDASQHTSSNNLFESATESALSNKAALLLLLPLTLVHNDTTQNSSAVETVVDHGVNNTSGAHHGLSVSGDAGQGLDQFGLVNDLGHGSQALSPSPHPADVARSGSDLASSDLANPAPDTMTGSGFTAQHGASPSDQSLTTDGATPVGISTGFPNLAFGTGQLSFQVNATPSSLTHFVPGASLAQPDPGGAALGGQSHSSGVMPNPIVPTVVTQGATAPAVGTSDPGPNLTTSTNTTNVDTTSLHTSTPVASGGDSQSGGSAPVSPSVTNTAAPSDGSGSQTGGAPVDPGTAFADGGSPGTDSGGTGATAASGGGGPQTTNAPVDPGTIFANGGSTVIPNPHPGSTGTTTAASGDGSQTAGTPTHPGQTSAIGTPAVTADGHSGGTGAAAVGAGGGLHAGAVATGLGGTGPTHIDHENLDVSSVRPAAAPLVVYVANKSGGIPLIRSDQIVQTGSVATATAENKVLDTHAPVSPVEHHDHTVSPQQIHPHEDSHKDVHFDPAEHGNATDHGPFHSGHFDSIH